MTTDEILALVDAEIVQLQRARALLSGNATKKVSAPTSRSKRHKMSASSRKKIADAQRKRWAEQRKLVRSKRHNLAILDINSDSSYL
jgi:hypothetical protein